MDALDAARCRYPVCDQVDARVNYVPEPGVIGIFIELDDGHQGFVDGRCVTVTRVSIHDVLADLPAPDRIQDLSKALAMLDIILTPDDDFEDRYFRYEPAGVDGMALATMENGSGDRYFIAFDQEATFAWGFAHESAMTPFALDPIQVWPGVLDGVPSGFARLLLQPRFMLDGTFLASTAFWSDRGDAWRAGLSSAPADAEDADGALLLFELLLDDRPEAFVAFADEYYERDVDADAVRAIYDMQPLTPHLVRKIRPDVELSQVLLLAEKLTYPVA